ncbi:MAG: citrate/2-methylcitrate synthase, partial [Fuerstiella sp.]
MEHSSPAPHLVNGLRQLLSNVQSNPEVDHSGLKGLVCGETDLIGFHKDGVEYCGINVAELCDEGSFEAVAWLLLNQTSADAEQLADICSILSESAVVDHPAASTISCIPLQTRPLDLFPLCVSLLSCFDPTPGDSDLAASQSQFWRVLSQLPVLLHVAFGGKLIDGRIAPSGEGAMTYAGQLLQVLRQDSRPPTAAEEHAMNAVMICECLTEMRPACFSARFFGSAVNDVVAGVKAASSMFVSQLRNDPFAWTAARLQEFESPEDAETWLKSRSQQAMPFGFQSSQSDSRAKLLKNQCRELLGGIDQIVMESSASRLETVLAREGQFPTTDWAAARVLTMLNVPEDRISLAIGIARMVGWAAQTIEQHV